MATGGVQVRASSSASFAALARDLRAAGLKDLRIELQKGLQRAARPLPAAIAASAISTLPAGGGKGHRKTRMIDTGQTLTNAVSGKTHKIKRKVRLKSTTPPSSVAERAAGAKYQVRITGSGKNARARIIGTEKSGKKIDLYALNQGRLRHPLFGDRRHWYAQRVNPQFFDRPVLARAGEFFDALDQAVSDVAAQINHP